MSPDPAERTAARLRSFGPPLLGMLVVEFLFGMVLNLGPPLSTGAPWAVLASSPALLVHVALALLLVGITANALRWASASGERTAIGVTAFGLASVVTALLAGFDFAFGAGTAAASFAMSAGFTGALIEAAYLLRRPLPAADPTDPVGRGRPTGTE